MTHLTQLDAYYLVPLLLICVSVVTGAWKKSISTNIYLITLFIVGLLVKHGMKVSFFILVAAATIMLTRAIINHDEDRLVKR